MNPHITGRHGDAGRIGLGAATTALVVGLIALLVAPMAFASSVQPELITETRSLTCDDLADMFSGTVGSVTWIGLKQDPPGDGVKTDGTLSVTISNFDGKSFDWSSNIGVDAVYVKAGSAGSYLYIYEPPAESTGDTGLTTPGEGETNQIGFIAFCYDLEDTTTTTSEATTTSTSEATTTSTSEATTTTSEQGTTTTTGFETTTAAGSETTTTSSIPTEVSPISIVAATTPEVSPETLPFTGSENGAPVALALVLIASGVLALVGAKTFRPEGDE